MGGVLEKGVVLGEERDCEPILKTLSSRCLSPCAVLPPEFPTAPRPPFPRNSCQAMSPGLEKVRDERCYTERATSSTDGQLGGWSSRH